MLKSLRNIVASVGAIFVLSGISLAVPAVAFAATPSPAGTTTTTTPEIDNGLKCGSDLKLEGTGCTVTGSTEKIQSIVTTVINIFSAVVGIVAVIMIIVGGFKYITSGGESGNITSAKNTIVYAVIGLVIVAFAQFIVKFVLNKANPGS